MAKEPRWTRTEKKVVTSYWTSEHARTHRNTHDASATHQHGLWYRLREGSCSKNSWTWCWTCVDAGFLACSAENPAMSVPGFWISSGFWKHQPSRGRIKLRWRSMLVSKKKYQKNMFLASSKSFTQAFHSDGLIFFVFCAILACLVGLSPVEGFNQPLCIFPNRYDVRCTLSLRLQLQQTLRHIYERMGFRRFDPPVR
jgi:hypothetical protein